MLKNRSNLIPRSTKVASWVLNSSVFRAGTNLVHVFSFCRLVSPAGTVVAPLQMRYVAAALLAALGGNTVDAKTIKAILGSVGIEAESDKLDLVVKELAGKNVDELIAEGSKKLASVPSASAAAPAAAAAGGGAAAAAEKPKEEKKKEEVKEESDDDMGFGLFD